MIRLLLIVLLALMSSASQGGQDDLGAAYQAFLKRERLPGLPNLNKPIYVKEGFAVCVKAGPLIQGQVFAQTMAGIMAKLPAPECVVLRRKIRVKLVARPDEQGDYLTSYAYKLAMVEFPPSRSDNMSEGGNRGPVTAWTTLDALEGEGWKPPHQAVPSQPSYESRLKAAIASQVPFAVEPWAPQRYRSKYS